MWPRAASRLFLLAGLILMPAAAMAQDSVSAEGLSARKIFALLFLMLGPIKILVPFTRIAGDAEPAFRRRLASRAVLFAAGALAVAALMGERMLHNFDIPVPILALTGGLVLFLIALQTLLQQFADPFRPQSEPRKATLAMAVNPIAFPTIVTPYGIAATIIFMSLAQDNDELRLLIVGLIAFILLLDWLAMLFAHVILKYVGTFLQVFAVVLGVNQVALGLFVIFHSLSQIGLFTMRMH